MVKTYIVGDIHGCIDPLRKLLEALSPDPAADRLILLGDLFDRGPDLNQEVFQFVKELAAAFGERFVLLRGNHEDYLLQKKLPFAQRLVWDRVAAGRPCARSPRLAGKMRRCTAGCKGIRSCKKRSRIPLRARGI